MGRSGINALMLINQGKLQYDSIENGIFLTYRMSQTRSYAALPYFFQGWQSTDRSDITTYDWDFGERTETDNGGRFF